jgi:hypothetical protein
MRGLAQTVELVAATQYSYYVMICEQCVDRLLKLFRLQVAGTVIKMTERTRRVMFGIWNMRCELIDEDIDEYIDSDEDGDHDWGNIDLSSLMH